MFRTSSQSRKKAVQFSSMKNCHKNQRKTLFTEQDLFGELSNHRTNEKIILKNQCKTTGNSPVHNKGSMQKTKHQAFRTVFTQKVACATIKNLKSFKEVLQKKIRSQQIQQQFQSLNNKFEQKGSLRKGLKGNKLVRVGTFCHSHSIRKNKINMECSLQTVFKSRKVIQNSLTNSKLNNENKMIQKDDNQSGCAFLIEQHLIQFPLKSSIQENSSNKIRQGLKFLKKNLQGWKRKRQKQNNIFKESKKLAPDFLINSLASPLRNINRYEENGNNNLNRKMERRRLFTAQIKFESSKGHKIESARISSKPSSTKQVEFM